MVTYYNSGDMTKFATYISNLILEGKIKVAPDGKYKIFHAHRMNWLETLK